MGVQMKVVTAQATSVTGCKQLFDEEQSSRRLTATQSRRPAEVQAVAGREQSGGDALPCWGNVRRESAAGSEHQQHSVGKKELANAPRRRNRL